MTTVYGVTFIGARDQIEKQLKDRKDIPEEECWLAASYLAKKVRPRPWLNLFSLLYDLYQVLACIGDIFSGAKGIQTWLNLCARIISKSIPSDRIAEALEVPTQSKRFRKTAPDNRLKKEQMTSVVWTTPLGLPIVQPYRKTKRKQIMTALQTVFISDPASPAEGTHTMWDIYFKWLYLIFLQSTLSSKLLHSLRTSSTVSMPLT